jgi:transposase
MSRPLEVKWQDSVSDIEGAYKRESDGKVKIRLHAIWKLRQGSTAKEVSSSTGYSHSAILKWLGRYKTEGISGLYDKSGRGRKCDLTSGEIAELRDMALNGELPTLGKAADVIENRYGLSYTQSGLWRLFDREGFSWKVPRKKHVKGDPDKQKAFKKGGSSRASKNMSQN